MGARCRKTPGLFLFAERCPRLGSWRPVHGRAPVAVGEKGRAAQYQPPSVPPHLAQRARPGAAESGPLEIAFAQAAHCGLLKWLPPCRPRRRAAAQPPSSPEPGRPDAPQPPGAQQIPAGPAAESRPAAHPPQLGRGSASAARGRQPGAGAPGRKRRWGSPGNRPGTLPGRSRSRRKPVDRRTKVHGSQVSCSRRAPMFEFTGGH